MKKALSIVLSVAMLMTVAFASFIMPVSAESFNLLDNPLSNEGDGLGTHTYEDGVLTITATGESTLGIAVATPAPIATHPFVDLVIESDVAFEIQFNDFDNSKTIGAASDFCWAFGNGADTSGIPAGSYNLRLDLSGAYTWTGDPVPENADINSLYIIPKAAGTVVVSKMEQTDGKVFSAAPMNSYDTTVDLVENDVDLWESIPVNGSEITMTSEGDTLILGNTNGSWPNAYIDFASPYVVGPDAMIYVDFTVAENAKTTIYLFFKDATCIEFEGKGFCSVGGADTPAGDYKGYVSLADLVPSKDLCCDEDGNYIITGIKVFATSDAAMENAVTIRSLDVLHTAPAKDDVLLGDVNLDGELNTLDVVDLFSLVSGTTVATPEQEATMDFNGDGSADTLDVVDLFNHVSGQA